MIEKRNQISNHWDTLSLFTQTMVGWVITILVEHFLVSVYSFIIWKDKQSFSLLLIIRRVLKSVAQWLAGLLLVNAEYIYPKAFKKYYYVVNISMWNNPETFWDPRFSLEIEDIEWGVICSKYWLWSIDAWIKITENILWKNSDFTESWKALMPITGMPYKRIYTVTSSKILQKQVEQ